MNPARGRTILYAALLFVVSACKDDTTAPALPPSNLPPRTFRMGFSAIPPRPDLNTAIAAVNMWSLRADAGIMSFEIPWGPLLSGVPIDTEIARVEKPLADFFRGKGLLLWLYLDPSNGLNRGGDSDSLVAHGHSIAEPAMQDLYIRYAVAVDSALHPAHLGLALETNLIRGSAPPAIYAGVRAAANGAAAAVRNRDPFVPLSVSIQVDYAWGKFDSSGYHGIDTDLVHFPFVRELGLSSYPYLAGYRLPEDVPLDYYSRIAADARLPVMVTEGGWTSASLGGIVSSTDIQRRYIVRQQALLDSARATAVFQLLFADLDLTSITLPPGSILPLFARIGLADENLAAKAALLPWDNAYSRRYTPPALPPALRNRR